MKKYYTVCLSLLFTFSKFVFSGNLGSKPTNLLNSLHDNNGWEVIDSSSNNLVSIKEIPGRDLFAVMVKKEINLPKEILQDVIMDINNYKQFLKSSGSFISNEIKRTTEFVDGYQFIPINIPFFDNREYFFRMYPSGFKDDDSISIIHWYLLNEQRPILKKKDHSATYLNHGAGLWVAENQFNNKTSFSYRIYMDPGGSLPTFLIDLINKTSVVNIFEDAIAEAQNRYLKRN
ncbi:MAG: hypothetical protein CMF94_02865 [Candidatus Marinimicrobia bacterium]|nr:hypothetical protein [Candidatus Neomarinimicrobiota bacterium]